MSRSLRHGRRRPWSGILVGNLGGTLFGFAGRLLGRESCDDLDLAAIEKLKSAREKLKLSAVLRTKVEAAIQRLEKADAAGLPVADGSADLVCGLQIYAYVPELDAALSEARRTLKTGGRLIILDTDFELANFVPGPGRTISGRLRARF